MRHVAESGGTVVDGGTPHITEHLRDDDRVLLDGLTGTVTLEGRRGNPYAAVA